MTRILSIEFTNPLHHHDNPQLSGGMVPDSPFSISRSTSLGVAMKARNPIFPILLVFAVGLSLGSSSATGQTSAPQGGCAPNGNRFDLEPLTNAAFYGQYKEAVAVILNRGGNGADLVVGGAEDERFLNPLIQYDGFYSPAYYVQRDNSNCAADFEGGIPIVGSFVPVGPAIPAADAAHDAFFIATTNINGNGASLAVGIVKSSASNLLNPTNCPNGTQQNPAVCWPIAGVANVTNSNVQNPSIAVDQRTSGTGAGDVYIAATTYIYGTDNTQITLSACTNSDLICSSSVVASGADTGPQYPSVQVRPDGGITIAYGNGAASFGPVQFKFVNCTPQGAPNAPTCSVPTLVKNEPNPALGVPGDIRAFFEQYPYHVDRLESDGKTVTSFLIYDQCAVPQIGDYFCPKTQVVLTDSTDGGKTWSPLQVVGSAASEQFLASIALDVSTGTVNIAYFSSQNDKLTFHTQVFLAQIPPGQTTVAPPHQITQTLYDGPFGYEEGATDLGLAVGGTGKAGQSRVYLHFTGSTSKGIYNGQAFRIYHNVLTSYQY
jgi:hypothetical protein